MYLRELSGSKFHSVTSSNVIHLYNDVQNSISSKVDLSGFGTELFNSRQIEKNELTSKYINVYLFDCHNS